MTPVTLPLRSASHREAAARAACDAGDDSDAPLLPLEKRGRGIVVGHVAVAAPPKGTRDIVTSITGVTYPERPMPPLAAVSSILSILTLGSGARSDGSRRSGAASRLPFVPPSRPSGRRASPRGREAARPPLPLLGRLRGSEKPAKAALAPPDAAGGDAAANSKLRRPPSSNRKLSAGYRDLPRRHALRHADADAPLQFSIAATGVIRFGIVPLAATSTSFGLGSPGREPRSAAIELSFRRPRIHAWLHVRISPAGADRHWRLIVRVTRPAFFGVATDPTSET